MSLSFGFGNAPRKGMAKAGGQMPGPGSYTLTNTVGGGPRVVMTPRRPHIEGGNNNSPGPGAYRPDTADKTPKWSFGASTRPGLNQTDASTPGPGSYSHGKPLGQDAPKFTVGARVHDKAQ